MLKRLLISCVLAAAFLAPASDASAWYRYGGRPYGGYYGRPYAYGGNYGPRYYGRPYVARPYYGGGVYVAPYAQYGGYYGGYNGYSGYGNYAYPTPYNTAAPAFFY